MSVKNLRENLIDRLNFLAEGGSVADFVRRLQAIDASIKDQVVRRWLTGEAIPKYENLVLIATATNCNSHWLLTGQGDPFGPPPSPSAATRRPAMHYQVFGHVSADPYTSVVYEAPERYETISVPPRIGSLRVEGNSMSPVAWDGQHILFLLEVPPKNKDLAIVKTNDGKVYFKHYFYDRARKLISLLSVNTTEPLEPILLSPADIASSYKVVGILFD